ncbi:ubiquitin-specific protease doa4, partial [Kickxella alabastrina]
MSSRLSDGRTNDLIRRFESLALIKSPAEDGSSSNNNSSSLLESPTPPTLTKQPPVSASGIRTSNLLYNSASANTMNILPVPSRISSFPELENTPPLVPAASTSPQEHATPGATTIGESNSVRTKAHMPGFSVSPMMPSNLPPTKFNNISASPAQVPMAAGEPKPRRKSLLTALNQRARINSSAKATSKSWLKLAERYMDEARLHQESGDLENAYLKYMLCLNIMDKLPKLRDFDAISKNTTYERLRKEHVTRMVDELEQLAKVLKTRPYVDPHGDSVPDAQVDAVEQLEMMEGKFAQMYPDHQLARSASSTASLSPMYRPIQSTQPVADLPGNVAGTALASTLESQWLEAQQQSRLQETRNRPRTIISRSRSDTLPGIAVINHGSHRSAMAISPNLASIGEDTSSEFIDPTVTTCMPLELWNLLDKSRTAANGRPTVLILDVRPHQDFVWGRIDHKYTVNIEPAVLHKGCTSADIESSLVLVSDDQQAWFRQRGDFDIVVYMSQSAHSFSDVGSVEVAALEALNSAIYHC